MRLGSPLSLVRLAAPLAPKRGRSGSATPPCPLRLAAAAAAAGDRDGGDSSSSGNGGSVQEDAAVAPQMLRVLRLVPQGVTATVAAGVTWIGLGCNASLLGQAAAEMGSFTVGSAAAVEGLYLLIHAVPLAVLLAPSLALSRGYNAYCQVLTTPLFFASEVMLLSWLAIATPLGRVMPLLFVLICHAALHLIFVGGVMVANKWFLRIQRERVQLGVKSPQIGVLTYPISQIIFLTAINSLNAIDAGLHAGYALSLASLVF